MASLIEALAKLGDLEVHRYHKATQYTLKLWVEWVKGDKEFYEVEHEVFTEGLEQLAHKVWTAARDLFVITQSRALKYGQITDTLKADMKHAGVWNKLAHPGYAGQDSCPKCYGEMTCELGKPDELYCPICDKGVPCD